MNYNQIKIRDFKSSEEFLKIYWLKSELVEICKSTGLPSTGSKSALTTYICNSIDKKPFEKEIRNSRSSKSNNLPDRTMVIPAEYRNDELHRSFFTDEIGPKFKFNVQFMKWMDQNKGIKTYNDAIDEWLRINVEKKSGVKYPIDKQFEYNQYTRDFFQANSHLSKTNCIACWNYKKSVPGNHTYHKSDLAILTKAGMQE